MKLLLLAIALCIVIGCATGGDRMAKNKLDSLKPGTTTRQEMLAMFGSPMSMGLDTNGKTTAGWQHVTVIALPFYVDTKHQMLSALFGTNDVLEKFVLQDDFKDITNRTVKAIVPGYMKQAEPTTPLRRR